MAARSPTVKCVMMGGFAPVDVTSVFFTSALAASPADCACRLFVFLVIAPSLPSPRLTWHGWLQAECRLAHTRISIPMDQGSRCAGLHWRSLLPADRQRDVPLPQFWQLWRCACWRPSDRIPSKRTHGADQWPSAVGEVVLVGAHGIDDQQADADHHHRRPGD